MYQADSFFLFDLYVPEASLLYIPLEVVVTNPKSWVATFTEPCEMVSTATIPFA